MNLKKKLIYNKIRRELQSEFADNIKFRENNINYYGTDIVDYDLLNPEFKDNTLYMNIRSIKNGDDLGRVSVYMKEEDINYLCRYMRYENVIADTIYSTEDLHELIHTTKDLAKFSCYVINMFIRLIDDDPKIKEKYGNFMTREFCDILNTDITMEDTLNLYKKAIEVSNEMYNGYCLNKEKK